jgi:hypothetical protein
MSTKIDAICSELFKIDPTKALLALPNERRFDIVNNPYANNPLGLYVEIPDDEEPADN